MKNPESKSRSNWSTVVLSIADTIDPQKDMYLKLKAQGLILQNPIRPEVDYGKRRFTRSLTDATRIR